MKHHIKIGKLGEEIACMFLMKHHFVILDRNYRSSTGELDIIAKKGREIHFFEVKSVSRETKSNNWAEEYGPSENLHFNKIDKVIKTAQCYMKEKFSHETSVFNIHGITVTMFEDTKKAEVKLIENININ